MRIGSAGSVVRLGVLRTRLLKQFHQIAGHLIVEEQLGGGEGGELFQNGHGQQIGVRKRRPAPENPFRGGAENLAEVEHRLQRGAGQPPLNGGDELGERSICSASSSWVRPACSRDCWIRFPMAMFSGFFSCMMIFSSIYYHQFTHNTA